MAQILDQHGVPILRGDIDRIRARGLVSGGVTPYDAADMMSPEMAGWAPYLGSPDLETTPYRDRSVARIRDLARNDGWVAGAVTRQTDTTIGADFRLSAQPDYRSLRRWTGDSRFDATWAKEFSDAAEAGWRSWAYDPGLYCDLERMLTVPQMFRLAFRHYVIEGESLGVLPWRPDRRGFGRARYATTMQIIDPDRLSNPQMRMDSHNMRGGVEMDEDGVPVAYHIRKAHMADFFSAGDSVTWERVERETEWGRPEVVHHYDRERAGQHRPIGGMLVPVLARMRMLAQYDRVELQAAIVNAIFGAYIESPMDTADIEAALEDDAGLRTSKYQELRSEFHQDRRLMAGNVRMASLFPGEKINTIASTRPAASFDAFEGAILRNFATAIGASFETVSGDYRGSSYSSARQAMIGEWRTVTRRRTDFGAGMCTPVYVALLEEMIHRNDVPLPVGAPPFPEIRAELSACRWIGPGRGWVDPTKEVEGARMMIASGMTTLEKVCEDIGGSDFIENMDQLKVEQDEAERRELTLVFDTALAQQQEANREAGEVPAADRKDTKEPSR